MTSRVQEHRYTVTDTRPGTTTRPPGELWLNFPDYKLGMIDATQTAVDLLAIRNYAATSTYALGDYVVHAGDLLRAKTALSPHAFTAGDWDSLPTKAQNDALYTTQAQNDARYYTKAQSDANYYNKFYIDTAFYTRTYIDANFYTRAQADGRYLQLTGGSLSGGLSVGAAGINYTVAGGNNHAMALGWNGSILAWVDGTYVGALATQAYVTSTEANYLPLSGGTITGNLQVNGVENVYGTLQNNNGRLITTAVTYAPTLTLWQQNLGAAMGFWFDGNLNFGGMDGGGNAVSYLGRLRADGSIEATNRIIGGQGIFANGGQDFGLFQYAQYRIVQYASNWGLWWDTTNGNLLYQTPSGLRWVLDAGGNQHMWGSLQVDGNLGVSGSLSIAGSFTAGYLHSTGDIQADGTIHGNNAINANGAMFAQNFNMKLGDGGSGRELQMSPGWRWDWNGSNGDLRWTTASNQQIIATSGTQAGNFTDVVFGIGPYQNYSDERGKTDIVPAKAGLAEVLALEPIDFRRIISGRTETGFSAQQLAGIIPNAVMEHAGGDFPGTTKDDPEPVLTMGLDPIVAALVNATKELAQRLAVLEGPRP